MQWRLQSTSVSSRKAAGALGAVREDWSWKVCIQLFRVKGSWEKSTAVAGLTCRGVEYLFEQHQKLRFRCYAYVLVVCHCGSAWNTTVFDTEFAAISTCCCLCCCRNCRISSPCLAN